MTTTLTGHGSGGGGTTAVLDEAIGPCHHHPIAATVTAGTKRGEKWAVCQHCGARIYKNATTDGWVEEDYW